MVKPVPTARDMIYSDVIAVLGVLVLKMNREGTYARIAHMFVTADESQDQIGLLLVGQFLEEWSRFDH